MNATIATLNITWWIFIITTIWVHWVNRQTQTNKHSFIHSLIRSVSAFVHIQWIHRKIWIESTSKERNELVAFVCEFSIFKKRDLFNWKRNKSPQMNQVFCFLHSAHFRLCGAVECTIVILTWARCYLGFDKRNATITLALARFNVPCNVRKPFFIRFWFNFLHH